MVWYSAFMNSLIEELIEKWEDIRDCSDEYGERTLAVEAIDDLKELRKGLRG